MLNSYAKGSSPQKKQFNDTRNGTSILPPEITSTPLSSPNRIRTASPLVTPTRKFIGPRRYALSSNGMLSPLKIIKNPPGPLLTSASYNVNVSTYIDTKSAGYTGRIVQYNEESSRNKQHTHQEKYGSPGLFPIVHLFKKDIPVISPKPKKATVRIGTPELKSQFTQEHNSLLLEGIVQGNSVIKENNHCNEVSTRSVLDALKEISRKRIHASEEYELIDETNKKLRRDCVNGDGDSSKRNRVDSPTLDGSISPPTRQATKKLCTIDAILASKTSSMYANYDTGTKRKTKEDAKTKISPVNKRKFINAETQTAGSSNPVEEKKIVVESNIEKVEPKKKEEPSCEHSPVEKEFTPLPKQVLKVFDDKPLEIIRKNRLGALLSALTGHDIPPIPMEDRRKALDQEWLPPSSEKPLVSILSPQNKQPKSVERHVTFSVPEKSDLIEPTTVLSKESLLSVNKNTKDEININSLSQNNSFESSAPANKDLATSESIDDKDKGKNMSAVPQGDFKFDSTISTTSVSNSAAVGGFKFDLTKAVNTSTKDTTEKKNAISIELCAKVCTSKAATTLAEAPKINFASHLVGITSSSTSGPSFLPVMVTSSKSINSSPLTPKPLFESNIFAKSSLPTPATNSLGLPTSLPQTADMPPIGAASSITPFTFGKKQSSGNSDASTNLGKSIPAFAFGTSEDTKSSTGFGNAFTSNVPSTYNDVSIIPILGATTTGPSSVSMTAPSFCIPKPLSSVLPPYSSTGNAGTIAFSTSTATAVLPASNSTATAIGSAGPFGSVSSAPGLFTTPSTVTGFSKPNSKNIFCAIPSPSFGGLLSSTTSATNLGTTTTSSSNINFNSGNSLPPFGNSSATPSFTTTSNVVSSKAFGDSSNFGSPAFGTKETTSSFGSTTSSTTSFGTSTNTKSAFGTTTTTSNFGTSTNAINTFNTDPKPFTFGSINNQNVGNPLTSVNTSSMFTLKNSQSGMTLGTNTTASSSSNIQFGSTTPSFRASSNNMFPSAVGTSSTFGQIAATQSFGTSSVPTFGATTVAPAFGATTVAPTFGATTVAPAFGSSTSISFGAPTTTTPTFGRTNTSNFGTPNTTTSMFGATNTPTFGTTNTVASGFGTSNTLTFGTSSTAAPTFGTMTPTFGASSSSSGFGTTNTTTFGTTTTASNFGTTNAPSFGSPSTFNAPSFGAPSAPFGAASGTTTSNTFNSNNTPFGNSAATNSYGGFGSTNSPFSAVTTASSFGTNLNNNFGTSNTSGGFGSSNTTNVFGNSNVTSTPFGGTPSSNTFGNNNAIGPSTFGNGFGGLASKPEHPSSIFPTQNGGMFGNNSTFGSPQSNNTSGVGSSAGVFTFGSPNAQPSSSTGVFAFGASDTPKSFNFSAPGTSGSTSAPSGSGFPSGPAFGQTSASMPNMFSIGSGASSTQNRSRPVARAKRRT